MRKTGFLIILLAAGLFYLTSTAQADWSPTKRLTWTSGESLDPAIAADSSNVLHVAWYDGTAGNAEIYYRKSDDGGSTWSSAKRLTWTSGESKFPDIAADSANAVHAVWSDDTTGVNEIYYRRSDNGGSTWNGAKRITWTSGESLVPDIVIDSSDIIHVVWHDDTPGNAEIYYKQSMDGGSTWSPTQRLTWTSGHSLAQAMAASSSSALHVAWLDYTPGNYEIYYKGSPDGGSTWNGAKRITWTSGYSFDPAIDIDSGNTVHVVWRLDTPDHMDLYYKRSPDGGATWSALKRLTWTSVGAYSPAIDLDSGDTIHLVWSDDTPGYAEIYYKASPDGGGTWSAAQRITWTSGDSYSPALVIDSGDNIHVVWYDNTPGNYEIYYKKGS